MHRLFGFQFEKPFKRLDTGVLNCKEAITYQAGQFNWCGVIFLFRKTKITTCATLTILKPVDHRVARLAFVEAFHCDSPCDPLCVAAPFVRRFQAHRLFRLRSYAPT